MKLSFILALCIGVCVYSCSPELVTEKYAPYYELSISGSKKYVQACGTTDYIAQYLHDTAVIADFECAGIGAGFSLKGSIPDGQYQLDHRNQAWYKEGGFFYTTDSLHKGTITIRTVASPSSSFSTYYIEGEISFQAIDKNSGKTINVSNGKYVLKRS